MKSFLFLLLLSVAAFAGEKPLTLSQAKALHSKADTRLNAAYKAAMKTLDEAGQKELREDQRAWLAYRDGLVSTAGKPEDIGNTEVLEMMAGYADERSEWLESYTKAADLPKGLTGEWSDSRGGRAALEERKDGVAFTVDTVRTRAFNIGGIAGIAQKNDTGARFTEKVPADEKREACELTFTLNADGTLDIKGRNTEPFHGNRAYFDGHYRKVAKLKKPVDPTWPPKDQ